VSSGIYLVQDDKLVALVEQPYQTEDVLQELLAKYPNLIAGDADGGEEEQRWLLIRREVSLASDATGGGRWSVDHLFLDQEAVPTIVEVKRSTDTRIRREVVGQMLDYAANAVVYWPIEGLIATFEERCTKEGLDPDDEIDRHLDGVGTDAEGFWQQARTNLQAGRVRLVFVADEIPAELIRIIEFLNGQMNPAEVVGIEIKRYSGQGVTTLVPKLVGKTAEAVQRKAATRADGEPITWDAYRERLSDDNYAVAREVHARVEHWITEHELLYTPVFRRGHFSFQRAGGYGVVGMDIRAESPCKFWVKLPRDPAELGIADPYPQLDGYWFPKYKQWYWPIPRVELVPDVSAALEIAVPRQPPGGPMPTV